MAYSPTTIYSPIKMVPMVVTRLTTLWDTLAFKKMSVNSVHFGKVFRVFVDSKNQAYLLPNDKK